MLVVPTSLKKLYGPFESYNFDLRRFTEAYNLLTGRLQEAKFSKRVGYLAKRQLQRISFGVVEVDVGAIADLAKIAGIPVPTFKIPVKINFGEMENQFSNEIQKKIFSDRAENLANGLIKAKKYALNVSYPQTPPVEAKPYFAQNWTDGETTVVEAALCVDSALGGLYLSDFPPQWQTNSDLRLPLNFSADVGKRLAERVSAKGGWEPFCQVLGQVDSLDRDRPALRPILVSLRSIKTPQDVSPDKVFAEVNESVDKEWEELQHEWTKTYIFLVSGVFKPRMGVLDPNDSSVVDSSTSDLLVSKRKIFGFDEYVAKLAAYENAIYSSCYGYIAGVKAIENFLHSERADHQAELIHRELVKRIGKLDVYDRKLLAEISKQMRTLRFPDGPAALL